MKNRKILLPLATIALASNLTAQTVFFDDFSGSGNLEGSTPDTAPNANQWSDDGSNATAQLGGGVISTGGSTIRDVFDLGTSWLTDTSIVEVEIIVGTEGTDNRDFAFSFEDDGFAGPLDDGFFMTRFEGGGQLNKVYDTNTDGTLLGSFNNVSTDVISTDNITYTMTIDRVNDTITAVYDGVTVVDAESFTDTAGNAQFQYLSLYGLSNSEYTFSSLEVSLVPEPSNYALIGGLLALASVMVRRRK